MRSFLLTILAFVVMALPMARVAHAQGEPSLQLVKSRQIFSGSYKVYGTNRNGSKYKGKAVIAVAGNKVEMSWLITSGQTYKGKGTIKNGRMVVDFGGSSPIIYTIDEAGILHGKWDRGRASEMLVPEQAGVGEACAGCANGRCDSAAALSTESHPMTGVRSRSSSRSRTMRSRSGCGSGTTRRSVRQRSRSPSRSEN